MYSFCGRFALDALKRLGPLLLLLFPILWSGCGDDDTIEPPPPPPQLDLKLYRFPVLPNNDVYDVFVDSRDRIWFCTQDGVGMIDGGQNYKFNMADGLPIRHCTKAAELNGRIWISTWGGGFGIYNDTIWVKIDASKGLLNNKIFDMAVDDTSAWISTVVGVSQYKDNNTIPIGQRWINRTGKVLDPPATSIEIALSTSRGSEVWFGSSSAWISVWRPLSMTGVHYTEDNSGIPGSGVADIAFSPADGLFWVAFMTGGVASVDVDNRIWTHYTTEEGLPSMIVHSVCVQQNGTVWVGTQEGVGKLSGNRFISYPRGSGLPEARVRRVYVDPDDRVWLGFIEGGAARVVQ